ncbi:unnamed protein product [Darwinula stevensoni]|uniref:Peptidase S1 domain-containing protein n=1 Tax=Darwinula stevensoni TaxID=69355 RepID=A0A7R9A827_9CRUS|nr:unnamed protein product [Darwinula stevensoni]CAG0894756.1 unnamed protein product [Darwinula stevensoni]
MHLRQRPLGLSKVPFRNARIQDTTYKFYCLDELLHETGPVDDTNKNPRMEVSAITVFLSFVLLANVQGEEEVGVRGSFLSSMKSMPENRQTPSCGTTLSLASGTSFPLISQNYPQNYPFLSICNWKFTCPTAMTLQCSAFQLPSTNQCRESAFIYNGNWVCGAATNFKSPVNVGTSLDVILYAIRTNGPGFKCTVTCDCGLSRSSKRTDLHLAARSAAKLTKADLDRIIGGTPVPNQGKYPWMAWMGSGPGVFNCGGALINDRYVLTAAHCIGSNNSTTTFYVNLGDLDRSTTTESVSIQIPAKAIVYPTWNPNVFYRNDIALLKLQTPVDFQKYPHIRPVCLSSSIFPAAGATVAIVGWGRLAYGGNLPTTLMETTVKVLNDTTCRSYWGSVVDNNIICAQENAKNTCNGDSGGPLLYKAPAGYYLEVGITSFGSNCDVQFGGGFTKAGSEEGIPSALRL